MSGGSSSYGIIRQAFERAADALVDVVGLIGDEQWDQPSLGEWTVQELVGHCGRAFSTVVRFVDEPATTLDVPDVGSYYRLAMSVPGVHDAVAQRGRDAGVALGDDQVATVLEWRAGALAAIEGCTGDEVGATAGGSMMLSEYLRTRIVELVVHTMDLVEAIGADLPDFGAAGGVALSAVVEVASDGEQQATILRALLGRDPLPPRFNLFG